MCEAFPVVDEANLAEYASRGCETLLGTLRIIGTPLLPPSLLLRAFSTVTRIYGDLHIADNPNLVTLDSCLSCAVSATSFSRITQV